MSLKFDELFILFLLGLIISVVYIGIVLIVREYTTPTHTKTNMEDDLEAPDELVYPNAPIVIWVGFHGVYNQYGNCLTEDIWILQKR